MFRSFSALIVIFAAAIAAAVWIGERAAREVESETANRAAIALSVAGHHWARAGADGAQLTISGAATSEDERAAALSAAAEAAPWARLTDETAVAPRQTPFKPATRIEFLRGVSEVAVLGAAPDAAALDAIRARLATVAPRSSVSVFARDDAAGALPPRIAALSAEIAADLLHGSVVIGPDALRAAGLTGDEAALDRIKRRLAALRADGVDVESDLIAPPPAATAFALRAQMDDTGGALTDCAAPDAAAAAALLTEAAGLFASVPEACRVGAGAPDARWTDAAEASMRAVAALPAGRISLVGRRARLTAAPPTRLRALTVARDGLAAELPPGYRLAVLAAPPQRAATTAGAPPETPPEGETALDFDGATLRLSGAAPTDVLAEAAAAFARARLTGVAVVNDLTAVGGGGGDWRAAVSTALSALSRLERGAARLSPVALTVEGEIGDPAQIAGLHELVVAGAGDERRATTRLRVGIAAEAAAAPTPPSRCALRLNQIVAEAPIGFEPGSTQIDEASRPVVAALVTAMANCRGGRIEIGGHTDSQGSAGLNMGLSRARAYAVMDALLTAGVDPALLAARGYGEARPVADNDTEEGRSRNRRIEFIALGQRADGNKR